MRISDWSSDVCSSDLTLADQIVENDQRAGLTPHDLATGIERMLGAGVTQAEIARALGRSKQFVSLYAACADMAPWLRAAIDQMPIRLLYDLHRAARTPGDAVRAYVARPGDEKLTLGDASGMTWSRERGGRDV